MSPLPIRPDSPLARALAQAKAQPAETGVTGRHVARFEHASEIAVICADTSSSMGELARGTQRKIDLLRETLRILSRDQAPGTLRVAMFGGTAQWGNAASAAAWVPSGGTPLHEALALASTVRPRHTLVVTDGHPDDATRALDVAAQLTGRLDVLFIGPESDDEGQAFCRRLAAVGAGTSRTLDLVHLGRGAGDPVAQLLAATRSVLALLPPTTGGSAHAR